jgi:hypothetical protein
LLTKPTVNAAMHDGSHPWRDSRRDGKYTPGGSVDATWKRVVRVAGEWQNGSRGSSPRLPMIFPTINKSNGHAVGPEVRAMDFFSWRHTVAILAGCLCWSLFLAMIAWHRAIVVTRSRIAVQRSESRRRRNEFRNDKAA